MKALITGANGFVGSVLTDYLSSKDWNISCLVRKSSNLKYLKNKKVNLIYGDLTIKSSLKSLDDDYDYIFHIAGKTFGRNFDEFYEANVIGTKNLIETINEKVKNIKRFVFLSSQTASGPSQNYEFPVKEIDSPNPITSYGKSKLSAEYEIKKFENKIPFTILRATAIYGRRDMAILPVFQSVKYGLGTLIGFKDKYISLLNVDDIVRGIYLSVTNGNTINNIYFLTSEKFYTWNQILEIIKKELNKKYLLKIKIPHFLVLAIAKLSEMIGNLKGKPPIFNYEKGIDFIQNYWTCSHKKAENDFNFVQEIDINTGISDTIKWYKENGFL